MRILIVATDGGENASKMYSQAQLLSAIDEQGVFVVMMGALLSDVDELRTLAGDHGVYFYARGYGRLKAAVREFIKSFGSAVRVTLPPEYADAEQIELTAGGIRGRVR